MTASAGTVGGPVSSSLNVGNAMLSGRMSVAWTSGVATNVGVTSLTASAATVRDAGGAVVGTGAISLAAPTPRAVVIDAGARYSLDGTGLLTAYGQAGAGPRISAEWDRYTGSVTGAVTIRLTTASLSLNGVTLPAGSYTIATTSAELTGSGACTTPNLSGQVTITATGDVLQVGPATGSLSAGGHMLNPAAGFTATGYSGSYNLSAGAPGTAALILNGSAANVVAVAVDRTSVTADQNTPGTFHAAVTTSLTGTYTLSAQSPTGWTVTVDPSGTVTALPAPGLQGGTYPVRISARSQTDTTLVSWATVEVTVTPTTPGADLQVAHDPLISVPVAGAQVPTAFQIRVQNTGPVAETFYLNVSNVPLGFTTLPGPPGVTVPAGQTGIVGVYLVPDTGQPIPPPGTPLSFTVTATSITDPAITKTRTVTFTVPAIDAVTVAATPTALSTLPGGGVSDTVTITNVGNVPANNVTFTTTLPSGLTLAGLAPVSLAVGQSTTEAITVTPAASTPLNTTLQATITATYGSSASPATQAVALPVDVVAPGVPALVNAAVAAGQLGNTNLANRLGDLSTALTNLVQTPTSAVYQGQVQASLTAVEGLLAADPVLSALVPTLKADGASLAQSGNAGDVQAAVVKLGGDLGSLARSLSDEAAHGLAFRLAPNTATVLAGSPADFTLDLQDTGNAATTYDLSVSGLPANVTAAFVQAGQPITKVTLQPGQDFFGGPDGVTLELTETGGSLFPTGFTATATAEGAPEITQSAQGSLTVPASFVAITEVDATPPFIAPGSGSVDVTAKVLNSVNQPQQALASYTVSDSNGNVVFTSQPVSLALTVQTSLATVDLGPFDTTGLAAGSDTISVTVTDPSGKPLPGGTGQGRVLIGTPVSASLSVSPTSLPAGGGTVTDTLSVASQVTFPNPLTLDGQVATTPTSTTVALDTADHLAYVAGTNGINIVDISDPASPKVLSTFAQDKIVQGGFTVIRQDTVGGSSYLVVGTTGELNANKFTLLVYALNDPMNPRIVSSTAINYEFMTDMLVQGATVLVPTDGVSINGADAITDQFGTVLAVDISDPAAPRLADALYNDRGMPAGGDTSQNGGAIVNGHIAYIASTTSTGAGVNSGVGRVLVVDDTDPTKLSVLHEVHIPGTVQVVDIGIQGNRALVVGSTGGYHNPIIPNTADTPTGNLTLSVLDISNPQDPQLIGTTLITNAGITQPVATFKVSALPIGNGRFAVSEGIVNGNPVLLLVDATDPNNLVVTTDPVPALVNEMAVSGNLLYTTSSAGLAIYQIGTIASTPITVSVEVPKGTGVSIVPGSFNIPPTQTVTGPNFDTLQWTRSLAYGESQATFTWQTKVTGLQAGQSLPVTGPGSVGFVSQGTSGSVGLPPVDVIGDQIIGMSPGSQTVQPAAPAPYTLTLFNPTSSQVTYDLSIQGVPAGWARVPASVTVAANASRTATLTLTSDEFTALGSYGFAVIASPGGGATQAVQGTLTLAGQPAVTPDANAHGIVATLAPSQATAGQETSARYVIQLTNTGSADDTFSLAVGGLPSGVSATLGQTTIPIPPGASNFRDVTLTLTPGAGTTPGTLPFTVTATSTSLPSVGGSTGGTLVVVAGGVRVSLDPASGAPGGRFQAAVTNTGTVADAFRLSLAGPAALVADLAQTQVTLAPGASQVVPLSTGAVDFALPGPLDLTVAATSTSDPAIRSAAAADVSVPTTAGLAAEFSPATQALSSPGPVTFLLMVHNTGNTEGSYTATITGVSGPVTAALIGLDGLPTQSIPIFRLPALSTGAIVLRVDPTAVGQAAITVQVKSLATGEVVTAVAGVSPTSVAPGPTPTPTPAPTSNPLVTLTGVRLVRGRRHRVRAILLSFSGALDPARARELGLYRLARPGRHGSFAARNARPMKLGEALYSSTSGTVVLTLRRPFYVKEPAESRGHFFFRRRIQLQVDGVGPSGLEDSLGRSIDGTRSGQPGGDAVAWITRPRHHRVEIRLR